MELTTSYQPAKPRDFKSSRQQVRVDCFLGVGCLPGSLQGFLQPPLGLGGGLPLSLPLSPSGGRGCSLLPPGRVLRALGGKGCSAAAAEA